MESLECLQWLRKNNLYKNAENVSQILKKVFAPCLGVKDEKILVIGDLGYENRNVAAIMSGGYFMAAKELKYDTKLLYQNVKSRGEEAESHILNSLRELQNNSIIILNLSDKLGSMKDLGKSFRKWIRKKNHRFVSAMGLGDINTNNIDIITNPIDVPYKHMQSLHDSLKKQFNETKEIRITTKAGTDIIYNVEGINAISADGKYLDPGTGGNLPAGEVYLPPNGRNVEGKVVIDGSSRMRDRTVFVKKPIELTIENGNIVHIRGGEEAKLLENTLSWAASVAKNPGSVRRICELGIGLNPKAQICGAMIVDDKALGSAHIGIGSNYWFGGSIYAIIHLDQVFRNPKIFLDGKELNI